MSSKVHWRRIPKTITGEILPTETYDHQKVKPAMTARTGRLSRLAVRELNTRTGTTRAITLYRGCCVLLSAKDIARSSSFSFCRVQGSWRKVILAFDCWPVKPEADVRAVGKYSTRYRFRRRRAPPSREKWLPKAYGDQQVATAANGKLEML